jgi:hypothetical protein
MEGKNLCSERSCPFVSPLKWALFFRRFLDLQKNYLTEFSLLMCLFLSFSLFYYDGKSIDFAGLSL